MQWRRQDLVGDGTNRGAEGIKVVVGNGEGIRLSVDLPPKLATKV